MPDVGRSDSQRSDASSSLKPRVSFNRDVHVKRIVPRGKLGVPSSAGIGEGSGAVSPVRKKPINKSQEELEEEAARVLQQVDEVDCVVAGNGLSPSRFYTLPTRKKKTYEYPSLDRRTLHRGSQELLPPKKPPRTFAAAPKSSIFDVFKRDKHKEPKKSNLRRSVSDVSSHKSKDEQRGINVKLFVNDTETKKQLSPIIEVTPREDYFDPSVEGDREDDEIDVKVPARKKKRQSITEKLKQFIDEVDEELYKETGVRPLPADDLKKIKEPQPIIIDVDKAEKISGRKKKFKASLLAKKFKVGKNKKNKTNEATKLKKTLLEKPEPAKEAEEETIDKRVSECLPTTPSPRIKEAIETLEHHNNTSAMIHSSQKPVDKLPLTKGRTVDPMVKRLSRDSGSSPPPKPNVMVTPHASVQHNNNQPFSYTRGLSPEKYNENVQIPGSPIIYAQVVCGNNTSGPKKQTIHTAYTNGKKHPHSDSDEGLGGEEHRRSHDYYDEGDKFEEESPITPKFRNPAFINGYNSFERKEFGQNGYIERGRGDGMDAKRRESLTEQMDNDFSTKHPTIKGRSDLSARRDLLESRIARRVNDSVIRTSPVTNTVYITESTSKYYRERSTSPVGYSKKYSPDPKPDRYAKPTTTDPRNKKYYGEPSHRHEYDNNRTKTNGYTYNGFDSEPKSFDSQISDYRSSPENRHFDASPRYNPKLEKTLYKDRTMYKSTPEIHLRSYQDQNLSDSYHDSLRREKVDSRITSSSKYRSERFLDENERKEKFVDSGIENDFRRDSGDNFRVTRPPRRKEQYCNESEDEGFASSLLIASEKQHTEENASQKKRRDYDSDRTYSREDDPYRHLEAMEYKSKFRSNEYIPRERSIDDGSHYDPRIDKDEDKSTLKRVDTKPPKPEKKSGLEKVKSLFTRKKDKQLPGLVSQDSLRARYVEYKGRESIEPKYQKKEVNDVHLGYTSSGSSRRRSSPSGSTTRDHHRVAKSQVSSNGHSNWFKSLDRLAHRKKSKKEEPICTSGTESDHPSPSKPACKNLRFFGDTDLESNDSIRHRGPPQRSKLNGLRGRSQSSKDLHNISEEMRGTNMLRRREGHRSMVDIVEEDRDIKGSRTSLKPPMSPSHRPREMSREKERARRRKNEVSSVESSTEGDSSQQSQRSIVYLHAATVGDIPGPSNLRNGRRAASREELASNSSSRIQPQVKTLSRSFSVLAPWRPRNPKEAMDIDYAQQPRKNGKYEQRVARNGGRKDSSSTLKKKAQESRKNQSNSTLNRRSRSKENLGSQTLRRSKDELTRGSNSTLYKKKERLPRENSRYNSREEKKMSSKSLSVESLGGGRRSKSSNDSRDISRSVSMPRDPEKSAGWFKMSKKKHSGSTQRL